MTRRTRGSTGGLLLLTALLAACREQPHQARFAVRGRWAGERVIAYRIETAGGTLPPAEFARSIRSALDEWTATGCASFREVRAEGVPALSFSWASDEHGECAPFGADPGVAHAGPVGPGTFVHFDSERAWTEGALRRAALHETGHVLGLDHSPDEEAIMYPEPSPARDHLAPSDLAGIHSLYGGGERMHGDLVVRGATGELVLQAVAPDASVVWAALDTDGDGDDEVVTWRTDEGRYGEGRHGGGGHGARMTYHFAPGPVLARALGPSYGESVPCPAHASGPVTADLDGDGRAETVSRR